MIKITNPNSNQIKICADIYCKAFEAEPWNEYNDNNEIIKYITAFSNDISNTKKVYILTEEDNILGIALCIRVPCVGNDFIRIEDFCINPDFTHKGYGSLFLTLIQEEALKENCNSIILATARNFPSHKFYEKNGFTELENSVYLYKEF